MKKLILIFTLATLSSCTENTWTKALGGTQILKIAPTEKLLTITWKEDNLWYLVQDTTSGTYYFKEKSALGINEGKVIITK